MSRSIAWSVALVTILAAAVMAADAVKPEAADPRPAAMARDPDLVRCRAAGESALADPTCRRAWDAARARFFGRPPS